MGKLAFVTGGSSEIGQAICQRLAAAGADVAFSWFSGHDGAAATTAAIEGAGRRAFPLRANFKTPETAAARLLEQLKELSGSVEILVHNAASGVFRPAADLSARHWQWCMGVNAESFFHLAQGIGFGLMPRGGRIVALSSLGAQRAIPHYLAVGASKAALEATARGLALELGPQGISVNVVSPGIVDTAALRSFPNRAQLLEIARQRTPMGRLTTADDVAAVVAFLCSPGAAMVHGQTIDIDGGYSAVA